jgi:hypothetical protein
MQIQHKAIAVNSDIGAFVPKTELINGKQVPILYSTQEEAQSAGDAFAIEIETKTGIAGWRGFIEAKFPDDYNPDVRPQV